MKQRLDIEANRAVGVAQALGLSLAVEDPKLLANRAKVLALDGLLTTVVPEWAHVRLWGGNTWLWLIKFN